MCNTDTHWTANIIELIKKHSCPYFFTVQYVPTHFLHLVSNNPQYSLIIRPNSPFWRELNNFFPHLSNAVTIVFFSNMRSHVTN